MHLGKTPCLKFLASDSAISERNGTESVVALFYGTNTFFAGENITACNSNPMNPTEYPSNKLSFIRIRRVVNDQNVHKTV